MKNPCPEQNDLHGTCHCQEPWWLRDWQASSEPAAVLTWHSRPWVWKKWCYTWHSRLHVCVYSPVPQFPRTCPILQGSCQQTCLTLAPKHTVPIIQVSQKRVTIYSYRKGSLGPTLTLDVENLPPDNVHFLFLYHLALVITLINLAETRFVPCVWQCQGCHH